MSKCRSCGAPVRWVVTVNGRRMPIDPHPSDDGNMVLRSGVAYVVKPDEAPDEARWISHFATCPNAKRHRRRQ